MQDGDANEFRIGDVPPLVERVRKLENDIRVLKLHLFELQQSLVGRKLISPHEVKYL